MSDEYHSYLVGRLGPDGVEMFDEPIDEGPVTPIRPEDWMPTNLERTTYELGFNTDGTLAEISMVTGHPGITQDELQTIRENILALADPDPEATDG